MDSGAAVEIESMGLGDRFEVMREGKIRIEKKSNASNFGG